MPLPLPKAELIGTLLETLGFGAYVVVFIECIQVLWRRYRSGRNMHYLFAVAVVIFGLIATHLIVDILRLVAAFTAHMDVANAPAHYYGNINTTLNLLKTAAYVAVTLVLDALIVYRTFVVWSRNAWVAAFPALLFLADIALSSWATWSLTEVRPGADVLVADVTLRVKYFYAVTLVLNLFCSVMIAWKIWSIHRNVAERSISGVRFMGVIAVIVESAAIYSCLLVVLITTSVVASTGMFVVLNAISPIIGIVFSAIIVRASQAYHTNTYMTASLSLASSSRRPSAPTSLPAPSAHAWHAAASFAAPSLAPSHAPSASLAPSTLTPLSPATSAAFAHWSFPGTTASAHPSASAYPSAGAYPAAGAYGAATRTERAFSLVSSSPSSPGAPSFPPLVPVPVPAPPPAARGARKPPPLALAIAEEQPSLAYDLDLEQGYDVAQGPAHGEAHEGEERRSRSVASRVLTATPGAESLRIRLERLGVRDSASELGVEVGGIEMDEFEKRAGESDSDSGDDEGGCYGGEKEKGYAV